MIIINDDNWERIQRLIEDCPDLSVEHLVNAALAQYLAKARVHYKMGSLPRLNT